MKENYFNSGMVQLKGSPERWTCEDLFVFQFRYGAIKSGGPSKDLHVNRIGFQFRYGAIKRY